MSYDFYAAREEIKDDVQDLYARIQLSANDLVEDRDSAKNQHNKRFMRQYDNYAQSQSRQFRELLTVDLLSAIECLPEGAAVLRFEMRLARPYISKDDTSYYICDNPVRKDWVFHLPMVSAPGWKGTLRTTASRILAHESEELSPVAFAEQRLRLNLLFGNEKEDVESFMDQVGGAEAAQIYHELLQQRTKTGFLAGRLRFYSTFFDRVTIEVINPHDRTKKAGKLPVYFEAADIGAKGIFSLLYVPFDLVGKPTEKLTSEIADDLKVLGTALQAMLNTYGFGAKTSSGFGVADEKLVKPGQLLLRVAGLPLEKPERPKPPKIRRKRRKLRRYWKAENQLKDEFLTDTSDLVPESQYKAYIESLGQEYKKSDRQLYDKARKWWEREGKELAEKASEDEESKTETDEPENLWAERTFTTLTQMVEKMESLAADLVALEETDE